MRADRSAGRLCPPIPEALAATLVELADSYRRAIGGHWPRLVSHAA